MTTRAVRHLAALALTAAALVGCADDPLVTPEDEENVSSGAGFEIVMDDGLEFEPQELTVPAGSVIDVRNRSSQAHSVTTASEAPADFDTGLIPEGETESFTVEEPGTYEYFCRQHPDVMQGVLIVE